MKEITDILLILVREIRELKLRFDRLRSKRQRSLEETWIDNQEIMQMLHISQRTLQTLRSSGIIPYSKINGKFYYKVSDIEKILQRNYSNNKIKDDENN